MKKATILLFLFIVVGFFVAGCGEKDDSSIRVGVIAELTGDMPAVGESCKKAAQLAVKEINDAGGLEVGDKRYKVKLFIEDNAGKADQSASAAQKLITQKKVVAIIGPNATRYAIPASEIAESRKSSSSPRGRLARRRPSTQRRAHRRSIVFRACFTDPFQGRVLARFAKESLKATKSGRPL